ncbi:unnamed protein product [Microthlaspi erraticum]|uniref:Ubiquitin-like protease family profile domain-containing protein n=1 Tax=Microthlaspi erraticum TaxID=1685480 RepID=A0A6D2I2B7_9BRAS|nr:unnamed protein product [Microthlaspi erraticum]
MKTPEKEKADVDWAMRSRLHQPVVRQAATVTLPQKGEEKRVPQLSQRVNERKYIGDPRVWGLFASRTEPRYEPINRAVYRVTNDEFKIFQRALKENTKKEFSIVTGHIITNKFFLEIAKKQEWVGTEHMEVIMTMLWRRRGEVLVKDRAVFVESAFTSLVASMYPVFKICDDKSAFDWGNNIRSFVSDIPGSYVEVLDPVTWTQCAKHIHHAYGWARTGGLYQNTRAGDCGPCAAKFLEMHAHRLHEEMSTVTDQDVDRFREKYAMDCTRSSWGKQT